MSTKSVCVVGSGNWGSVIARIVGNNVLKFPHLNDRVTMYVYEEMIDGKKLTDIINETHENVKYLPGYKLPPNVVALPDIVEAAKDADILIFVLPHQFIKRLSGQLLGKIKPNAVGLSLIKGFDVAEGGGIDLISHIITRHLKIPCSVLMGANLANEVADETFGETTIGCKDPNMGSILKDICQTDFFRVTVVDDTNTVEVCGALKNIVACGAGFIDGLGMGDNVKAAVIRLGLMEMIKFVEIFYPGGKLSTFFESCGVADLITTCYGGRNRRVSEAFVKSKKSVAELEAEMLGGQKLQGPFTAEEVNHMLKHKNMEDKFPLFTAVHKICKREMDASEFIDAIRFHPVHMGGWYGSGEHSSGLPSQNFELKYVQNEHLKNLKEDYLYHITLNTSMNLREMFGDVKFVCTGGTGKRMKNFAEFIAKEIDFKFPCGMGLLNLSSSADRYSMYKVGPIIAVNHGMGNPSTGILINELIKLIAYADCKDPIFFRIGTCGGIGHEGGTVIISEDCCDGFFKKCSMIPVLGKPLSRETMLDKDLVNELKKLSDPKDGFKIVSGTTLCADDFYQGQARLDGAFCDYDEEDKQKFLQEARCKGVVNMEMESTIFSALTHAAGIRAAVVCVALLNRLNGDQVVTSKETLDEWQLRPQILVARYIKKTINGCKCKQ